MSQKQKLINWLTKKLSIFFCLLDFSDISLLRLPADVEEIVSNIDYSITDDIIEQFEKFYYEKPSKHTKQQQQQQQQQCVC